MNYRTKAIFQHFIIIPVIVLPFWIPLCYVPARIFQWLLKPLTPAFSTIYATMFVMGLVAFFVERIQHFRSDIEGYERILTKLKEK